MSVQKILNIFQLIKNYQEVIDIYKLEQFIKKQRKKLINQSNSLIDSEIKNDNNNNIIKINSLNKMIIYRSKVVSKMELSIELLYNIFFKKKGKKGNINIFYNIVLELIKSGFKIKEFHSLSKIGIPFYVDEDIFYNEFLGIDKNKYVDSIINNNSNNLDNVIFPIQGNLFLPIHEKINNNSYKNNFINDIINQDNQQQNMLNNMNYINKVYYVGEMLYLLRPIIYLTLLSIFRNNKIIPLIINIIIDIVIYFSRMKISQSNFRNFGLTFLSQKVHYLEMKLRNKNFFVYLFREPIFSYIIIPLIAKTFQILHIPNFIVNIVLDIMENFSNISFIA